MDVESIAYREIEREVHEVLKRAGGTYRVPHTYWKSSLSPASLSKWRPVNRQCPSICVKLVSQNVVTNEITMKNQTTYIYDKSNLSTKV